MIEPRPAEVLLAQAARLTREAERLPAWRWLRRRALLAEADGARGDAHALVVAELTEAKIRITELEVRWEEHDCAAPEPPDPLPPKQSRTTKARVTPQGGQP